MKITLTNGDVFKFANSDFVKRLLANADLGFNTKYALFLFTKKAHESIEAKAYREAYQSIIDRYTVKDESGQPIIEQYESYQRQRFTDEKALLDEITSLHNASSGLEIEPIKLTMHDCQVMSFTTNDLIAISNLPFFEIENV